MNDVDDFLAALDRQLDAGREAHADQSFVRPITATEQHVDRKLLDVVGWLYVLWCQAARKAGWSKEQANLRPNYLAALRHRIARNDRGRKDDPIATSPSVCMADIEILALDCYQFRAALRSRLKPIARAIEVAQLMEPDNPYRSRRGGVRDPRSDD
jgi:hypothetical protein